jgi:hypothetical protein
MIHHIALFAWKPGVTRAQEAAIGAELTGLKARIPGIVSASFGRQNSPEGLGKGMDVGLAVVFTDAAARDAYLPHPAHQEVVARLKPLLADLVVLDYEF